MADDENTTWQSMTTQERTTYLKPAIENGWHVRLAFTDRVESERQTFGPDCPIEWSRGVIKDLRVRVVRRQRGAGSGPGMYLYVPGMFGSGQEVAWDDLYDVQIVQPEPEPEVEPQAQSTDGGQILTCPHCGGALCVTVVAVEE